MKARWLIRGLKVVVIATVAAGVFGFLVMSLWNWLAPAVFGLRAITFWQALGILILSKILFGGFRGRPGYGGHWRRRMSDRWKQMTPEERETFRQGIFDRCGRGPAVAEESRDPRHV
jgi:hypothetical protein